MRHLISSRTLVASKRLAGLLALAGAALISACSSLTPIERLVIAREAEPLLAQIRAGEVGIDEPLPWGGAFGVEPSYFTPLCAAAFGGAVAAVDELLALGADVDVECSPSITPLDLAMAHRAGQAATMMSRLLQAHGANARWDQHRLIQARL